MRRLPVLLLGLVLALAAAACEGPGADGPSSAERDTSGNLRGEFAP